MNQPVIISAVRTPVGKYMGALREVAAYDLASLVLNEAVKKANIQPDQVDEVITVPPFPQTSTEKNPKLNSA